MFVCVVCVCLGVSVSVSVSVSVCVCVFVFYIRECLFECLYVFAALVVLYVAGSKP